MFDKGTKAIQRGKEVFSTSGAGTTWKDMNPDNQKTILEQGIGLNVKARKRVFRIKYRATPLQLQCKQGILEQDTA